jgi:hypothetical protein
MVCPFRRRALHLGVAESGSTRRLNHYDISIAPSVHQRRASANENRFGAFKSFKSFNRFAPFKAFNRYDH